MATIETSDVLLNEQFLAHVCAGDEGAMQLLAWMIRAATAMYTGRPVGAPSAHGTPEFRRAHRRLVALGLTVANPAAGNGYYELKFSDLIVRYRAWAGGQVAS